jgi:hypothetical protein
MNASSDPHLPMTVAPELVDIALKSIVTVSDPNVETPLYSPGSRKSRSTWGRPAFARRDAGAGAWAKLSGCVLTPESDSMVLSGCILSYAAHLH